MGHAAVNLGWWANFKLHVDDLHRNRKWAKLGKAESTDKIRWWSLRTVCENGTWRGRLPDAAANTLLQRIETFFTGHSTRSIGDHAHRSRTQMNTSPSRSRRSAVRAIHIQWEREGGMKRQPERRKRNTSTCHWASGYMQRRVFSTWPMTLRNPHITQFYNGQQKVILAQQWPSATPKFHFWGIASWYSHGQTNSSNQGTALLGFFSTKIITESCLESWNKLKNPPPKFFPRGFGGGHYFWTFAKQKKSHA